MAGLVAAVGEAAVGGTGGTTAADCHDCSKPLNGHQKHGVPFGVVASATRCVRQPQPTSSPYHPDTPAARHTATARTAVTATNPKECVMPLCGDKERTAADAPKSTTAPTTAKTPNRRYAPNTAPEVLPMTFSPNVLNK
jgi:hypothetical protein